MKTARVGTPRATGYGLAIIQQGLRGGRRLQATTLPQARREAIRIAARSGPVMLCRAVAVGEGGRVIYERGERIELHRPVDAMNDSDLYLIAPTGVLVQKKLNYAQHRDAERMAAKLATQLRAIDKAFIKPYMEKYLATLDVNWSSLSTKEFDQVFRSARKVMSKLATSEIMPVWSQRVKVTIEGVARDSRKIVHDFMTPRVGVALQAPEMDVLRAQAAQTGWFLRNEFGLRSDRLTAQGRAIVQNGIRQGLGREAIARDLRTLPGLWDRYGFNYARTVASNAVNRARTVAEVSGYMNAGIDYLEVQAVLDERTTEICRSLDGTIVEVHVAWKQLERASSITNPEDIYTVSPFLQEKVDPTNGQRFIQTTTGHRVADVMRSGVGRLNDRGMHRFHRTGKDLTNVGVGTPPYHHGCRSWTVPMSDIVSIPVGMTGRTAPIAPRKRPFAPLARPTTRPGFAPRPGTKPKPSSFARPAEYFKATAVSRGVTTMIGQTDPLIMAERLGYPVGMEEVAPRIAYRRVLQTKAADAVTAKYQLQQKTGKLLESPAGWRAMRANLRAPDKVADVLRKQKLNGRNLAVSMRLPQLGPNELKQIVLWESKYGASRLYTVRGLDDARATHLHFNLANRSKANEPLARLRSAKTDREINDALKAVRSSGFLRQKTVAAKVSEAA